MFFLALAALGLIALRPSDRGAPHDPYFLSLSKGLRTGGMGRPSLVLDLDRLDGNLSRVSASIQPPKRFRIVAKSLPSIPLLRYVAEKTGTNRMMVFDEKMLLKILTAMPGTDTLIGKPLPVSAADWFYDHLTAPAAQPPQWLIDTPQRLEQYRQLAIRRGLKLKINVEIDVGLHRGGVTRDEDMQAILSAIASNPEYLSFAGYMGYDAHVMSAPPVISSPEKAHAAVLAEYRHYVELLDKHDPALRTADLTWNGGGSKTYRMYESDSLLNDLALGSALVMPTDFDVSTLTDHQPAIYIATPVLKRLDGARIPFVEFLSPILGWYDRNQELTYFVYGGLWKAKPESPAGLQHNSLYGSSSNQEMLNGSRKTGLLADDYVFYRPTQSEAVMAEFGDLVVVRGGKVVDRWAPLGAE